MNIIDALNQLREDIQLWVANNLRTKVSKEAGKGLSTNDYTNEEKAKLASIDAGAISKLVRSNTTVTVDGTTVINIPETIATYESVMVYHDGLLLIEDIHYQLSADGKSVELLGYAASAGDVFTFINKEISAEARLSESWAVGGTGEREGEDTNNSKYYAEMAKSMSTVSDVVKVTSQEWLTANERLTARSNIGVQATVMPTASADYVGHITQYVGETNAEYKNGYQYRCVDNGGTYSWEIIDLVTREELLATIDDAIITVLEGEY